MILSFKIKKYYLLTIALLMGSWAMVAQNLSDQQIGFDVARTTTSLQEHGVKPQDLARELTLMREIQQRQYLEMKKIEEGILQKTQAEQTAKASTRRITNTAKTAFVDVPQNERDALITFYNSTGGSNWKNTLANNKPWKINDSTSDVSTWFGIEVSNGHVTGLGYGFQIDILIDNNLSGTIPPEIGNLTELRYIDLETNNLSGPIPAEIGNLRNLILLALDNNPLTGSIPKEIGNLTNLKELRLTYTQLTGSIPTEIGKLTNLFVLYLASSKFSGTIPKEIGSLTSLGSLWLGQNQFTGTIPLEIGNLYKLETLFLNDNQLLGNIPSEIGNLTKLRILSLDHNQLTGSITTEISNLTNLEQLYLNNNQLSGSIPSQIGNLKSLFDLNLSFNQLSGSVPSQIGNFTNLSGLNLSFNQLTGLIPKEIFNNQKINAVDLSYNQLTGSIPIEINNIVSGNGYIYLQSNQLTGFVPITNIDLFTDIYIQENKFRFLDLVTIVQLFKKPTIHADVNYYPQAKTDLPETITKSAGQTVDLIMYTDDRFHPSDTYQWFKNGAAITGANSRIYTIASLTAANEGVYTCKSYHTTNPDMSPLVLEREPITLTISNCPGIPGDIQSVATSFYTNTKSDFTFATKVKGLSYVWSVATAAEPLTPIATAPASTSVLYSYTFANPGDYEVKIEVTDKNNCVYKFVKDITVKDQHCVGEPMDFGFDSPATGLSFTWSVKNPAGAIVNTVTNTTGKYSYTPTLPGDYLVQLTTTTADQCTTTFSEPVTVTTCNTIKHCIGEPVVLAFASPIPNLSYAWTVTNATGVVVDQATTTTGSYTFVPKTFGSFTIQLVAGTSATCVATFTQSIVIDDCISFVSCTKSNLLTAEIKRLFLKLANKLASLPAGGDPSAYAHYEMAALRPYVNGGVASINNFVATTDSMSFSFVKDNIENDVVLPKSGGIINDIDLSKYDTAALNTKIATTFANGTTENVLGTVRSIDFCPKELNCVNHVAIVVDESGSLSSDDKGRIRKQLRAFMQQQAEANDENGSNMYISLIGMADREKKRDDNILPTRVTNLDPSVLAPFYTWITTYGSRNGASNATDTGSVNGIGPNSDYWKSGLDVALESSLKPKTVFVITDGCETENVAELKTTLAKFNNVNKNPELPHLYVIGLEKGFYIDQETSALPSGQNPNLGTLDPSDAVKLTNHLTKSLQFLLGFPATEFPKSDVDNFVLGDYYDFATGGVPNFYLLDKELGYISDKMAVNHIGCGDRIIVDSCDDCFSFQPQPGKEYVLTAWVKEESNIQLKTYTSPKINLIFYNDKKATPVFKISTISTEPSGDIIDGWQRIIKKFIIPENTITIGVELKNASQSIPVYYDDIRIHPVDGSLKTFVYDSETFKLMSELDENNYATFYEYDNEGGLVRVKKETAKGVKTIQETRSGSVINTKE
jgi:Leucine-rich repeat (LRR) protein